MSKITKLPDGSAFFTATVMSKKEAMRLPLNQRPICFRISSEMYHAVFEAIGSASMCWNPRPGNEVFASEEASRIAVELCFKIANELEAKCAEMREAQIKFPDNLSALTVGLVLSFAQAMADKLSAAQIKHGYGDGWAETTHEWPIPECHEALMSHLKKGDPVDVANFCAFLWYHKIGTTDCGKGWRSPEDYAALEAKCADMWTALTRHHEWSVHQSKNNQIVYSGPLKSATEHALSGDCGKGWVRKEEGKP